MKTRPVTVTDHNPQWEQNFEAIAAEIRAALGELALAVHHVGSTAVPGMAAKPIIDLDVEIIDYTVFPAVVEKLEQIGYFHEGDLGIPQREAFRYEGKPHLQTHHLYVSPTASPELKRHLTFRDHLRSHPEAVREYSRIKKEAAALFPDDIDGYIRHKCPCIDKLYVKCGLNEGKSTP